MLCSDQAQYAAHAGNGKRLGPHFPGRKNRGRERRLHQHSFDQQTPYRWPAPVPPGIGQEMPNILPSPPSIAYMRELPPVHGLGGILPV